MQADVTLIRKGENQQKGICQRLAIKKAVYERNTVKGIRELMVYAFGVDGLPPW